MKAFMFATLALTALVILGCAQSDVQPTKESELSIDQQADLLFLYEEEKMARDLYVHGRELYGTNQFTNISSSEQVHMDAVSALIGEYEMDVALVSEPGAFTIDAIKSLYYELLERIQRSEIDAFKAATLVEETDIMDIREIKMRFDLLDITEVLDQLECGSGNHMRAFNKRLEMLNVEYTPEVMSQSEFDQIISEGHAHCGM